MYDTDDQALVTAYEAIRPRYKEMTDEVLFELEDKVRKISASIRLSSRVKEADSLIDKTHRKQYQNPLEEITDLAGVRIVCQFSEEVTAVEQLVRKTFKVVEEVNKSAKLKDDRMGYQATHFIVRLPTANRGSRYDQIKTLVCEIQVKNILQDAWAQIDHLLMYKSTESIPEPQRRELNKVSVLLEIAQDAFDRSNQARNAYVRTVQQGTKQSAFLEQAIDRETVSAYTQRKFPGMPVNPLIQELFLRDLDRSNYKTLADIDRAVDYAEPAITMYRREAPKLFQSGSDVLTKSLGFADATFMNTHPFGSQTRKAFEKYAFLLTLTS